MKPIYLTQEDIEEMKKEFEKQLILGMYDGSFSYSKKFTYKEKEKAYIYYTPEVFARMFALITHYNSEVAWHCLVERMNEPNKFRVYDILVYDQIVTGATVNTDDTGYANFMMSLTDEQANHLHCQCHSHVNMTTSPSQTDIDHQKKILATLNSNNFYIFQIWNKKFEHTDFIYDLANNVYYENNDIEVLVEDPVYESSDGFVQSVKDKIINRAYTTNNTYNNGSSYSTGGYYVNGVWTPTQSSVPNKNLPATTDDKKTNNNKKKEPWYMSGDQKGKGEKDYDKEIFNKKVSPYDDYDDYYSSYASGYYDS